METAERDRARQFSAIFAAHYGHVHAYAARRAGRDAADDIAAETLLIAWRRREVLPEQPLPWLYGIARNVVARHHDAAARGRAVTHALAFERPAEDGAPQGADAALAAAWASLGERDREVLSLIAWEELTVREAAVALGCSAPVFSVRLHRARRRLERALGSSSPSPAALPDLTEAS